MAAFLSACGMERHANTALQRKNIIVDIQKPVPHCYGYGCVKRADIALTKQEWEHIESIMTPASNTPAQERQKTKQAIAAFEQIMGEKAGTASDKAGTFKHMGAKGNQLDCVDESLNTTIYLTLLEQKGWLSFHSVGNPSVRLPIIHAGRWPHQTAVIHENNSGRLYAVDSWFHNNGAEPEILPLEKWKAGWKPG
ncbi:MAG: hypothetical protein ACLFR0_04840 [Alphaproteobacteria bacterium]